MESRCVKNKTLSFRGCEVRPRNERETHSIVHRVSEPALSFTNTRLPAMIGTDQVSAWDTVYLANSMYSLLLALNATNCLSLVSDNRTGPASRIEPHSPRVVLSFQSSSPVLASRQKKVLPLLTPKSNPSLRSGVW